MIFKRLYFKSKLELNSKKSYSSNAKKFVFVYIFFLYLKPDFRYSSLSFVRLSKDRTSDNLVINRQNFARVGLQVKLLLEYG